MNINIPVGLKVFVADQTTVLNAQIPSIFVLLPLSVSFCSNCYECVSPPPETHGKHEQDFYTSRLQHKCPLANQMLRGIAAVALNRVSEVPPSEALISAFVIFSQMHLVAIATTPPLAHAGSATDTPLRGYLQPIGRENRRPNVAHLAAFFPH